MGAACGAESDHGTGNVDQDVCWKCGGLHLAAECKATKQEKLAYKMKQMEKMKAADAGACTALPTFVAPARSSCRTPAPATT